jgi:hypothetical protein
MLWNPYNADFTWVKRDDTDGDLYWRNGYRYRMRLLHDTWPLGSSVPEPWNDVEISIGYRWTSISDPTLPPVLGSQTLTSKLNLTPDPDTDIFANPGSDSDTRPNDVTVTEFTSDSPGAISATGTNDGNIRMRAGDVALFQGVPFVRGGSGGGGPPVLTETVTLANPNSSATTSVYDRLEMAVAVHSATAATVKNKVTLEVYARLVDESGDDVENTSAVSVANPQGFQEQAIFSKNYELEFAGYDKATVLNYNSSNAAWSAYWIPPKPSPTVDAPSPAPPVFPTSGASSILDVDPSAIVTPGATGETALIENAQTISLVVGSQAAELFSTAIWNAPISVDLRSNPATAPFYQSQGTFVALGYETGAGLAGNDFGRLGCIANATDSFPILFEAPRVQPISVGELMQLQGGPRNPLLLGVDPNEGTGSVKTNITDLNYKQNTWDGFFFSTIPSNLVATEIGTRQLANTRLEMIKPNINGPVTQSAKDAEALSYLKGDSNKPPAAALRIVGPFNVNSSSIPAWESVLRNTPSRPLTRLTWDTTSNGFRNTIIDATSSFSRLAHAPGVGWTIRHSELSSNNEPSLYRNGFRELAPLDFYGRYNTDGEGLSDISLAFSRVLTQAMRVRIRNASGTGSPFLNLGDFVNSGVLQTAIDNVAWTQGSTTRVGLNQVQTGDGFWVNFSNLKGVPSYLSQRDIMKGLAPVLTARSDTFIIRTYGDVVNPTDATVLEGKAWCEALVQRETDYIDPVADDPEDTPTIGSVNNRLGRRYRIIAFRWLGPNDI